MARGKHLLKVVDKDTNFQNSTFVHYKKAQDVSSVILGFWLSTCAGYPKPVKYDQKSGEVEHLFWEFATAHEIQLHFDWVKS